MSPANNSAPRPAADADSVRSEALLPASPDEADDGRYNVAEEVSLDQQSDSARHIGQAPADDASAAAIAEALTPAAEPNNDAPTAAPPVAPP